MRLSELNLHSESDAELLFMQCCTSSNWSKRMVSGRPYKNITTLKSEANSFWEKASESDFLQAFEGHPKIGNIDSLREKYSSTKALASGEQSSVSQASEQVITDLATGNEEYLKKFGFIFIVCATGKSAEEMLELLEVRMHNNYDNEMKIAAGEQHKITIIRLNKLLS